MQQSDTDQKQDFLIGSDPQDQAVVPEKANIYGHDVDQDHTSVSNSEPGKGHQHFIQRQQNYTGDA